MSPERIAELHRTTLNMDVLDAVPVQPVCSADLDSQVHALRALATLFGLYDGADFLRIAAILARSRLRRARLSGPMCGRLFRNSSRSNP